MTGGSHVTTRADATPTAPILVEHTLGDVHRDGLDDMLGVDPLGVVTLRHDHCDLRGNSSRDTDFALLALRFRLARGIDTERVMSRAGTARATAAAAHAPERHSA